MISFLHEFLPQSIFLSFGPLTIYWYGLFMALAIASAMFSTLRLAPNYNLGRDTVFDLSFWMVIAGLAGARVYEIFLMWPYYKTHPGQMIRVWEGGLAIHGAIIAGLLVIWIFSYRHKISILRLSSLLVPGVALGQAIGRWGNYFNQELFGLPTTLPWGIPIDLINRPLEFINESYFHPTFIYESLGCLSIAVILLISNYLAYRRQSLGDRFYRLSTFFYVISYSLLRFSLEFIRIDETPVILGWRWPQIASLLFLLGATIFLIIMPKNHGAEDSSNDQK